MESSDLPPRFPCWVKAVYSWGGESKRDLGFIEGDLIECLNAGDGSWWVGRLYRDKRMVGSFPSNFVKVLDDSYHPVVRISKTAPPSAPAAPSPSGGIKKSFSPKPYSSMKTAGIVAPKVPAPPQAPAPCAIPAPISRGSSPLPHTQVERQQRAPSPLVQRPLSRNNHPSAYRDQSGAGHSRAPSPLVQQRPSSRLSTSTPYYDQADLEASRAPSPYDRRSTSRAASPMLCQDNNGSEQYRAVSQASYDMQYEQESYRVPSPLHQREASCMASPALYEDMDQDAQSPPPPPPPAHRTVFSQSRVPSPAPYRDYHDDEYEDTIGRQPSPTPSNRQGGRTPSPFRNAMDDVINSLDEMSVAGRSPSPGPQSTAWSSEYSDAKTTYPGRVEQIPSLKHEHSKHDYNTLDQLDRSYTSSPKREATPKLANYLRRMDSRLKEKQGQGMPRYNRASHTDRPPIDRFDSDTTLNAEGFNNVLRSDSAYGSNSRNSYGSEFRRDSEGISNVQVDLRSRKSAYELGRPGLGRSLTAKSTITDFSSTSHMTDHSLMSGYSAGGFSATSAGSLARRDWDRSGSAKDRPKSALGYSRTGTSLSDVSYHSSHASNSTQSSDRQATHHSTTDSSGLLGGFQRPVVKKRSFLRRVIDSAKTGAASARSTISADSGERSPSPQKMLPNGSGAIAGGTPRETAAKSLGLESSIDWLQMRRDVNRCNSLSRTERNERAERCEMMDITVINPISTLLGSTEGDESQDGYPVTDPTAFSSCNFSLVDKNVRFISNIPDVANPSSVAQSYICRPYRSDVQRLRAVFTWISERIHWEEDFEGDIDTQRVLHTKRGCSEEIAVLAYEMCNAIGVHAEVVRGHLKEPGELLGRHNSSGIARPNHWWNAVIMDGEWRIMDCSLASPTNPRRKLYSNAGNQVADPWWFLTRPLEVCYTHVPEFLEQQHIIPPVPQHVLMALPVVSSAYFKNNIQMWDFDTSMVHLEGLEAAHIHFTVPEDVECIAEVEARSFAQDVDGDFFESGNIERKRVLTQAEFLTCPGDTGDGTPFKQYTVKAVLPASSNSSNQAVLQIYAGRRGLMHSINNNPHPLALSIPLSHQGVNPAYEFFTRHPTPHALRHELYVVNPLCKRLAINNTFVFCVRQHAASASASAPQTHPASALSSSARPTSALSMASASVSASAYSNPSSTSTSSSEQSSGGDTREKPAKLAMQSPSGKILRMTRKLDQGPKVPLDGGVERAGSAWETIIKIGERGVWRGLVLADRSARWCVFGEWECV